MRARSPRLVVIGAVWGLGLVIGPLLGSASAHEARAAGPVRLSVGWANEPAYAGFLNAVQLRVTDDAGAPVTDVGDGMKVEVSFGDQKVGPLPLTATFGSPGEYRAPLIPTRPGVYTFRFTGTIRGQAVDQSFTSSDRTFDSPKEPSEIEFPAKDPSRAQLAGRLERLDPRVEEVRTQAVAGADDAESSASRATMIAVAGLAVGLAGLVAGVAGLTAARRARSEPGDGGGKPRQVGREVTVEAGQ
ncbi:MAG: hypothetical protein ACRD12_10435 [Acidimicrobiales bacterium]